MGKRKGGIAVAGILTVDILYPVSGLPGPGELTTIRDDISRSTGGAVCNVAMDLARLDPQLRIRALGRVGEDEEGDYVLGRLRAHTNIDLSGIRRGGRTSFTAVMADELSKQRTFFHCRGANAFFCEDDIDFDALDTDILHVGYILLLDALDLPDEQYGTRMARLLHDAKARGIRTSVDVVTEAGDRFTRLVPPALKYTDYCVINEMEAQYTTGLPLRGPDGALLRENIPRALTRMKELGVARWAVIHSPEGGFGLDESGEYAEVPCLRLDPGEIAGSVGAGDAFCAGVLYMAWKGAPLGEALQLGTAAAACSLMQSGSTEGVVGAEEAMRFFRERTKA